MCLSCARVLVEVYVRIGKRVCVCGLVPVHGGFIHVHVHACELVWLADSHVIVFVPGMMSRAH